MDPGLTEMSGGSQKHSHMRGIRGHLSGHQFINSNFRLISKEEANFILQILNIYYVSGTVPGIWTQQ